MASTVVRPGETPWPSMKTTASPKASCRRLFVRVEPLSAATKIAKSSFFPSATKVSSAAIASATVLNQDSSPFFEPHSFVRSAAVRWTPRSQGRGDDARISPTRFRTAADGLNRKSSPCRVAAINVEEHFLVPSVADDPLLFWSSTHVLDVAAAALREQLFLHRGRHRKVDEVRGQ